MWNHIKAFRHIIILFCNTYIYLIFIVYKIVKCCFVININFYVPFVNIRGTCNELVFVFIAVVYKYKICKRPNKCALFTHTQQLK